MSMKDVTHIIGIDEAGRGPLAGPVAVGAVSIPVSKTELIKGVKDSKKLTPQARLEWFRKIKKAKKEGGLKYSVACVGNKKIDEWGISRAVRVAIQRAIFRLEINPRKCLVLLDGLLYAPKEFIYQKTIIKGDEKKSIIAAASIMAKVTRDRKMVAYSCLYRQFGFEAHKGYGTLYHRKQIKKYGPCVIHRQTYIGKIMA